MIFRAVVVLAACSLGTLAVFGLLSRTLPSTIDRRQLTATPPPHWWTRAVATSGRG